MSALALSLAVVGPALAHSEVHHSEPADGAVLGSAPPAIVLMFHQPVRVMTLRLLDEAGHERKLAREGARTAAVQEVRATVQDRLAPGGYRVEWRGASEDGHVGGGAVAFRIEPGAR
ncbi:copper resistance CopC family protein [Dankookia rubra]|uniref:copper resistance CopC family protein n=1 Tax=Dankookia rubra TaxID=1442381 RepID=UPI0014080A30|nr:copper resistance protein CopC [Dankookia rubra]